MNHFQKSSKKLEKLRGVFFQLGIIAACGLSFLAFEWKTVYSIADLPAVEVPDDEEYDIPPLMPEVIREIEEIKVERPPIQIDPTQFEIVDDKTEIVEEPNPVEPVSVPVIDPGWEPTPEPEEADPFRIVEEMPDFVGGEKALFDYLGKNIKYPKIDIENGNEGIVYVQFVVGKNGGIESLEVVRGVSPTLDREALRVVQNMPNWKPGKQRGKKVKVIYNLPIHFKLK